MSPNLKSVIFDNEESRFLLGEIAWAKRWLAMPACRLPGTLTHEQCREVMEDAQDKLIDHYGLQVIG